MSTAPVSTEQPTRAALEDRAHRMVIEESGSASERLALALALKKKDAFASARKLLESTKESEVAAEHLVKWLQTLGLCTYKDPERATGPRLDKALSLLRNRALPLAPEDVETNSLIGGVYKRKWEFEGQAIHLEHSAAYYLAAHRYAGKNTDGYPGVNAAFVLDLLAREEQNAKDRVLDDFAARAGSRRAQATQIRQEVLAVLLTKWPTPEESPAQWWARTTVAEAFFGMGTLNGYEAAAVWLRAATEVKGVPEWERESTVRQLAALARLQENEALARMAFEDVLSIVAGSDPNVVRSLAMGKVGLALSGGGFRAALFHLGVLAHLAELDLLRHVEVLSCVSGGSIVGTVYYLKLKRKLEEKDALDQADYLSIVLDMERSFLAAVQKNLRMLVFADADSVAGMIDTRWTHTDRLGQLYDQHLYRDLLPSPPAGRPTLGDLKIDPKDDPAGKGQFNPKTHNWRRGSKVPMLVINATALNTGHNWQFTSTWMGEPPEAFDPEVEANDRLRRLHHHRAPTPHRNTAVGTAVAASSCVPGLFAPIVLDGLYPKRKVRLVDGGVYDNQGIASLLEQGCNVVLVSDGCGQSASAFDPGGMLKALPTSNDALMQRVREAGFQQLKSLKASGRLRNYAFVHLKKDLENRDVDWIDCPDPTAAGKGALTKYGIRRDVQKRLAEVRTDLDCFHDLEANALMYSGYAMTCHEAREKLKAVSGFLPPPQIAEWGFLQVRSWMVDEYNPPQEQLRLLGVSASVLFKAWFLAGAGLPWKWRLTILALLPIALLMVLALVTWTWTGPSVGEVIAVAAGVAMLAVGGLWLAIKTNRARGVLAKTLGAATARLVARYMNEVQPRYLESGALADEAKARAA